MSIFNKCMVMIAFAICTTNAWAGSVMKNDPNAIGILDCIWENNWVAAEVFDCSDRSWSHNFHSTKAICKKFVADAYYNKYKDDTGMTGGEGWPDNVTKLPKLIDDKYMLRCVAIECEDGYELARDKKGNSMGWCQKKNSARRNGFNITLKNGQKLNNLSFVDFTYADVTGKVYGTIAYVDKNNPDFKDDFEMGDVSRIDDKDVSSFLSGAKTGHIENASSWIIYECDTNNAYIAAEQIGVKDELQHWLILSKPECASSGGTQCENIPVYKKCVKKSNNGESESGATSTTVFDNLDKFISEKFVGSSVWKNDEGNFNTARLVSDSVAGVVLGTAGGIITSHIIKKNQIENGFDDLKCTIGGQTVASYGDEFRVGVK